MSRRLILALVCLSSVLIFLTQTTNARLTIKVNEADTRFFFKQLAPEVSLVVVNNERDVADVSISLQLIDPQDKALGKTERRAQLKPDLAAAKQQLFTPRLREYFPETLLWQPELTTDKKGRAQLDFILADTITTWKLSVIGSTENGELGTAETEIRAFQPFFAKLDPPRLLTEGDRISLPVVLRNYLEKKQTMDLQLSPATRFKTLDPTHKQVNVSAGDSDTASFDIQAVRSIIDDKQQVLNFKFKPRMAMNAKAAASVLYDYYNPEARVVIPPGTFLVK